MQTTISGSQEKTVTFHKKKIYIPQEIQDQLGLEDGDKLIIQLEKGEIRLRTKKSDEATKRLLAFLENPPALGEIKGSLRRRDIYADRPRL